MTTFQHVPLGTLLDCGVITRGHVARWWKWSHVRNPYSRLVSIFSRLSNSTDPEHVAVIEKHGPGWRRFAEWATSDDVPPLGSTASGYEEFSNRQLDWLRTRNGSPIPNLVLRLEELDSQVDVLEAALGSPLSLQHRNCSPHMSYDNFYNAALQNRVGAFYQEEIDLFRYAFGDP